MSEQTSGQRLARPDTSCGKSRPRSCPARPDTSYCPLSEERVVRLLIQMRGEIDQCHDILMYAEGNNIDSSNGVAPLNEDVSCIYIDLDSLIDGCGLNSYQRTVVDEMMKGYAVADIAEEFGWSRATVHAAYDAAVKRIVHENNRRWQRAMAAGQRGR